MARKSLKAQKLTDKATTVFDQAAEKLNRANGLLLADINKNKDLNQKDRVRIYEIQKEIDNRETENKQRSAQIIDNNEVISNMKQFSTKE